MSDRYLIIVTPRINCSFTYIFCGRENILGRRPTDYDITSNRRDWISIEDEKLFST